MRQLRLRPSERIFEAEWLARRLRSFGSGVVAAVVPDEFPAYVRILHPALGTKDEPVRWADVAAWSGRGMHRLVQLHAINRLPLSASAIDVAPLYDAPQPGNLPADLLSNLCAVLAGHTRTADLCWFCLWDGYGWLHGSPAVSTVSFGENSPLDPPDLPSNLLHAPRVHLPNRNYLLFEGPLDAATELGWTMSDGGFEPQSPNIFWPQDHAWCVASEIDLFCTLVGGSVALAETLIADPLLEVWRVFPGDPIVWGSDEINT